MAAVHQATTNPPNHTVYVKNLEERIKPDELKSALSEIFSEYGNIIDLVAKKNLKAKGQAFIVFDDVVAAQKAIEEVQGFELFEKPMILDFAKTRSDATVQKDERKQAAEAAELSKTLKRQAAPPDVVTTRPIKSTRGAGLKSSNPAAGAVIPEEYLPPNKILFVQNLPDEYGVDGLTAIFARVEGFKEVRLVPGRKGIAFVEYEAESGAISAKESTAGMTLGEDSKPMKVVYQRQ